MYTPKERTEYLHEAQKVLVSDNFYVIPAVTRVYICLINPENDGVTTNDRATVPVCSYGRIKSTVMMKQLLQRCSGISSFQICNSRF